MTHTHKPSRRGFTLIELLVVVAIISILAAILFPVMSSTREKARQTACLSNMKQIGLGIEMYIQDHDERLFYRAASSVARVGSTRSGVIITNATAYDQQQWWNLLLPYARSTAIYSCPGDALKPASPDINGNSTIPRSYVASCASEGLADSQITDTADTLVITDKWSYVDNGIGSTGTKVNSETWMEPFDGDECMMGSDADPSGNCLDPRPGYPVGMVKMAGRHSGGMNSAFFDGHARWLTPGDIWQSPELTGCALVHQYPGSQTNNEVCDQTLPNCAAPVNRNVCNIFYR